MAPTWLPRAIYAALLSQAIVRPAYNPPTTGSNPAVNRRPVVYTPLGDLRGVQKHTTSNVTVDTFLGIPFATPPVGRLRFNKPLPTTKWTGVRDAAQFGDECLQRKNSLRRFVQLADKVQGNSEDCLYLNVYKPRPTSSDLLPVMVWIHGGGYYFGAGSQYEGSELASKGVIVVTINYRLDIFGFLSNEDDAIPGNYGMLDQILALKWVKQNIQSFGGDPDKVTIFGESAGSSSVSLLVLSPLASGLFARAIMESGTSLSPWAVQHPATRLSPSQFVGMVGALVDCNHNDALEKLECMRHLDAGTLLNASLSVDKALGGIVVFGSIILKPVVENVFGFLPDLPTRLWSRNQFNHVDTMRGFNAAEDGVIIDGAVTKPVTRQDFMNTLKANFKPYVLINEDVLVTDMLQYYFRNESSVIEKKLSAIYALSDIDFKGPSLSEAGIESKLAPERNHFVYEFDYKPSYSVWPSWMRPVHAAEIPFVFWIDLKVYQIDGHPPTATDRRVGRQMQNLWTNFATYGSPTRDSPDGAVKWDTFDVDNARVLKISEASKVLSYKNHSSFHMFPKFLKRVDIALSDTFVVG